MSGIRDQENIDELRKRLYERDTEAVRVERHRLTRPEVEVSRGWAGVSELASGAVAPEAVSSPLTVADSPVPAVDSTTVPAASTKPRHHYRLFVLVSSLIFFIITAAGASLYLYFGPNQISASNISINVSAPLAIPGGDVIPLQINISNQNSVAIDEATLIINYPSGTRATGENGKELFEERIDVNTVAAGESINIPVRAILFGEENEEKEIKASFEYTVEGSNGTYFKEAPVQIVKISSSPLVVRITGVETVSSGQEVEVKLLLQSNSPTTQRNILVNASYPNSFSFIRSSPEPSYSQNSWIIDELKPEATYEITLRGLVTGLESELSEIQLQAGNPQLSNQFIMGSVLSQARYTYRVERPFTNITVDINGDSDSEAVLAPGADAQVTVTVTNTLDEAIYDMRVELLPRGNLIRDNNLLSDTTKSFFEDSTGIIRYEVSGDPSLAQIGPRQSRSFSFFVRPDPNQSTGSFNVSANIFARRVNEVRAAETLVGTALAEAKYSSQVTLGSQVSYGAEPLGDSGAIPPIAGRSTTYTVTLVATAGVNDITGAEVSTSLPQSVTWTNKTSGDGTVEYNPVSQQIRWNAGDITARQQKTFNFQVSLLPSVTQVGLSAILVGAQYMQANDRFTGVPLTASARELTNELSTEFGFIAGNGIIQAQ